MNDGASRPLATYRASGRFWRVIAADRAEQLLDPPGPQSAGRYHRPGERALYITTEADWGVIAVGRYMLADGRARVAIPLDLDGADLFDQRDAAACAQLGVDPRQSMVRWNDELASGRTPPSWIASDSARQAGAQGIIDISRGIAGGWHVCLFDWNRPGAPQVTVAGPAQPCDYAQARARWPSPPGWSLPPELVIT